MGNNMTGTEVFDVNKMPERRLHAKAEIVLQDHQPVGAATMEIKRNMAFDLVQKILEDKSFFWSNSREIGGYPMIEYGADCIIMTEDEFLKAQHGSFGKGIKHALGFMPINR